jgi:hypothetical protein
MRFNNLKFCTTTGALIASLALPCVVRSQAKDWDFDRAQYVSDLQLNGLFGPVRNAAVDDYQADKHHGMTKMYFDANGNLERMESRFYGDRHCLDNAYTYDAAGNRLTEVARSGHLLAERCEDLLVTWSRRFSYEFNARGAPTAITVISELLPRISYTSTYAYDSIGRLLRMDRRFGSDVTYEEYTYAKDPRGLLVTRHRYSRYDDVHLTFDVTRKLIFSPDGKLLKVTQTPPDVVGFEGSEVSSYSGNRNLIKRSGAITTTYSKHDRYGNWTESSDSRGVRIVRQIEY